MATVKVASPVEGFTGLVAGVSFKSGAAEVDRSNRSALSYFRRHGYQVGDAAAGSEPAPPDPRQLGLGEDGSGIVTAGTRLRDAAVDPRARDFLPPTNAGKANPHGPEVVSPGLHGSPPAPIVPGPVSSSPATQEAKETASAEEALVDQDESSGDTGAPYVTIEDVLASVHGGTAGEEPTAGWQDRARDALDAELAKGDKARKTLLSRLQSALAAAAGAEGPQG